MAATTLSVKTPDGVAECHFYRPEGSGPFPGVVFLIDAMAVRPAMHQMAERLSKAGFAVLLPNVYYRAGTFAPFDPKTVWSDEKERARLMGLMGQLEPASVMRDMGAYLEALSKQDGVKAGPMGAVGYCMGGRFGFMAASSWPDRLGAVASIHGGNLVTDAPDSPHTQAGKIKARLYFGIADNDRSCTPEQQAQLKAALDAAQVRYQTELYPNAPHGFAVPDTPAYNAEAAEKHWERVVPLFREAL